MVHIPDLALIRTDKEAGQHLSVRVYSQGKRYSPVVAGAIIPIRRSKYWSSLRPARRKQRIATVPREQAQCIRSSPAVRRRKRQKSLASVIQSMWAFVDREFALAFPYGVRRG